MIGNRVRVGACVSASVYLCRCIYVCRCGWVFLPINAVVAARRKLTSVNKRANQSEADNAVWRCGR